VFVGGKGVLVGVSGGAVASEFALTHPERVLRLVLEDAYALDASLALPFLRDGEFRTRIVGPALLEARTGRPPSSTPARACLVFHDPNRVPAEVFVVRYPGGWVRNYWGRTLVRLGVLQDMLPPARRRAFVQRRIRLSMPTLIVWGESDRLVPASYAEEFRSSIRDSRVVILPECAHMPMFEKPEEFVSIITEFLQA